MIGSTKNPSADNAAIRVEALGVSFAGHQVLKDVTISFGDKRLSVVIGRSGSGKTTLLRSLNRLNEFFPQCETSGNVTLRINDRCVDVYTGAIPVTELRRRVGMVFQSPNVLPTSIVKNIALPLKLVLDVGRNELTDRVEEALRSAHLWEEVQDRLKDPAYTLSGGQQQRLCLARALALQPDVLLLDEPTGSLDFRAAVRIEDLLLDLKDKYTIIAVSHSLSQTRRLADAIVILREGRLVQSLSRSDFSDRAYASTLLEEAF